MSDQNALDCIELVELVTDYFEDALSPRERTRVEHHLADCDGCTAYVRQMRATAEVLPLAAERLAPAERAALIAAFRAWKAASAESP